MKEVCKYECCSDVQFLWSGNGLVCGRIEVIVKGSKQDAKICLILIFLLKIWKCIIISGCNSMPALDQAT